jgi:hypothetical protein
MCYSLLRNKMENKQKTENAAANEIVAEAQRIVDVLKAAGAEPGEGTVLEFAEKKLKVERQKAMLPEAPVVAANQLAKSVSTANFKKAARKTEKLEDLFAKYAAEDQRIVDVLKAARAESGEGTVLEFAEKQLANSNGLNTRAPYIKRALAEKRKMRKKNPSRFRLRLPCCKSRGSLL